MKLILNILIVTLLSISCSSEQKLRSTNEVSTIENSEELIIDPQGVVDPAGVDSSEELIRSEEELAAIEEAEVLRAELLNDFNLSKDSIIQNDLKNYKIVTRTEGTLTSITGLGNILLTTITVVDGAVESREHTEIIPASFRNNFVQRTTSLWKETSNTLGSHEHNVPALNLEGFYQECFEMLSVNALFHYHFMADENSLECGNSSELTDGEGFEPQIKIEIIPTEATTAEL